MSSTESTRFGAKLTRRLKQGLQAIGRTLPDRIVFGGQSIMDYVMLGHWVRANDFRVVKRVPLRSQVYEYIAEQISEPILYLEFGVFYGQSMRDWCRLLKHPTSRLVGFDSFEGLPEDFDLQFGLLKGTLEMNGRVPVIDDTRVSFVKGWFSDTLPKFAVPDHEQLVINVDCDLYSATKTIFDVLGSHIRPGTIVMFDDMSQVHHEPKAFAEYFRASGKKFTLMVCSFDDVFAFKCIS